MVVSTSSIALQKAILTEYIPFLSRVLLDARNHSVPRFGQWCEKGKNTLSVTIGWNNESKQSAINRRMLFKKQHYCPCESITIWIA